MFNPETKSIPKDEINNEGSEVDRSEEITKTVSEFLPFLGPRREMIDNHEIACVLGDDKSARIPALIFGRTINKIYSSRGKDVIPLLFIDPHTYTGAMGGSRGYGKKDEDRLSILRQKIKNLFEKSGIDGGTILLVTDYIDTGSTIDTFKDIVREAGLKIETISNDKWYGSEGSGLGSNDDLTSIHAKPLTGNEQPEETTLSGQWYRTKILIWVIDEIKQDKIFLNIVEDINTAREKIKSKRYYLGSQDWIKVIEELKSKMNDEQKKKFVYLFKKHRTAWPRTIINEVSDKLAEKYIKWSNSLGYR